MIKWHTTISLIHTGLSSVVMLDSEHFSQAEDVRQFRVHVLRHPLPRRISKSSGCILRGDEKSTTVESNALFTSDASIILFIN